MEGHWIGGSGEATARGHKVLSAQELTHLSLNLKASIRHFA